MNTHGDKTFAAAGPRPWNSLPAQLHNPDITYGLFRRQLKGHLFREAWTRRSVTCDTRRHRKALTYLLTDRQTDQTWNWVTFWLTQRPSDPWIQRPGDPVDPVTLFYNELQMSTYVADKCDDDIRYCQNAFGCLPVADIIKRRTCKFLQKFYVAANVICQACTRRWYFFLLLSLFI